MKNNCGDEIDANLVNEIAYGEDKYKTKKFEHSNENLHIKVDNIYSFASKYCSWHNPNYLIADSYSKGMLYYINKSKEFYGELNDYITFNKVYNAFKHIYFSNMDNIDNKTIDTYLWTYAKERISNLEKRGLKFSGTDNNKTLADYIKL